MAAKKREEAQGRPGLSEFEAEREAKEGDEDRGADEGGLGAGHIGPDSISLGHGLHKRLAERREHLGDGNGSAISWPRNTIHSDKELPRAGEVHLGQLDLQGFSTAIIFDRNSQV